MVLKWFKKLFCRHKDSVAVVHWNDVLVFDSEGIGTVTSMGRAEIKVCRRCMKVLGAWVSPKEPMKFASDEVE